VNGRKGEFKFRSRTYFKTNNFFHNFPDKKAAKDGRAGRGKTIAGDSKNERPDMDM
jgi:hypothetical protein